ncbi:MAG: hypothetical protein HKL95_03300 [Phycisphaerae bacterium]|nr:hypothetical protein [Phycisphaerae bacterium]
MAPKCWPRAVFVAVVVLWLFGAHAHANQFGRILVIPLGNRSQGTRAYGYYQYRFRLMNVGTAEHRVGLMIPAVSNSAYGPCLAGIRGTYELPAHCDRIVSLLQPCLPLAGHGLAVWIDGWRQRGMVLIPQLSLESYYGPAAGNVILLSSGVSEKVYGRLTRLAGIWPLRQSASSWPDGGGPSPRWRPVPVQQMSGSAGLLESSVRTGMPLQPTTPAQICLSGQPVEKWSGQWLGYSSYAALVITQANLRAMVPRVRAAIWSYVQCGGTLLLLNGIKSDVPRVWRKWHRSGSSGIPVQAKALSSTLSHTFAVGFGLCLEAPERAVGRWNNADWSGFSAVFGQPIGALRMHSPATANGIFAVVRSLAPPVRSLLAILAIFAVVVGPVNLLVLGALRKRMWLYVTTPAIALLFAAAVFVYTAAVQGWSGVRRVTTFTILNQAAHQATTIGWLGYYTPLTLRHGLHFDRQTELTPEVGWGWNGIQSYGYQDLHVGWGGMWRLPVSYRYINWTHGQDLSAGWVTARVPALFAVRKAAPSQAHITIGRDSTGHITAVNHLGVPVRLIWYADSDGRLFRGGPLLPGIITELQPAGHLPARPVQRGLRALFLSSPWPQMIATAAVSGQNSLHPNCYLAVLGDSPFMESGLAGAALRPAPSVVYGIGLGGEHAH